MKYYKAIWEIRNGIYAWSNMRRIILLSEEAMHAYPSVKELAEERMQQDFKENVKPQLISIVHPDGSAIFQSKPGKCKGCQ